MKSVSSYLLVIILVINISGMGLIAVIGNVLAGTALNDQSLSRIGETTALNAGSIEAWVERQAGYIDAIAAGFSTAPDISPEGIFPALVKHTDINDDYFAVYAGYPDGIGVFNDEWEPDYNVWKANERDWYKGAAAAPEEVYITELYKDAETGNFCMTFSKVFTHKGRFAGVVAIDIFTNVLSDVVNSVNVGQNSYAFLTDGQGEIIIHDNENYAPALDENEDTVFKNIGAIEDGHYAGLLESEILDGESIKLKSVDGTPRYYTARVIPSTGWILYTAIPVSIVDAPIYHQIIAAAVIFVAVLCLAFALTYFTLRKLIVRPIKEVTKAATLLAQGETGVSLSSKYVGEIDQLAASFKGMEEFNREQTEWLERIADGDLSMDVRIRGDNDRIGKALDDMLNKLNRMFTDIHQSTAHVDGSSRQIADGAQTLAQGSTEQAAAVEELSSSISELADKTRMNAAKAKEAAALAGIIKGNAEKGDSQMGEMIHAVENINESGQNISKVIKVIDDIAFQTNILALNAAVEAARAGQHGKGFAVVAEEVRNLASKSAESARNINTMIRDSSEKANDGTRIAAETARSLNEIVSGIVESSRLITEIAKSSDEQSLAIKEVNAGIDQVAQVIQQNSATAEESAAVSEEMSSQANILQNMISHFRLRK